MNRNELEDFCKKVDQYIITRDLISLAALVEEYTKNDIIFSHPFYEAHYLYSLGNCYSELYKVHNTDWYSNDLMKAIISYRKALHTIPKVDWKTQEDLKLAFDGLRSMIETNLANHYASQGRVLCCIPHYDEAISIDNNPVAIIAKASNQRFLGQSLFDHFHSNYHYFIAYTLVNKGLANIDKLHPEQRTPIEGNGDLLRFKKWFDENFEPSSFGYFEEFKEEFTSKKQQQYLEWCSTNRLFLNDLNDVCQYQIAYQDVFALPSFMQSLNSSLALHEQLAYHGNYDELKNDYCYARYLIFSAKDIPDDTPHIFNSTYQHVDDMSHSINNLKVAHYKSAFRAIYSLFDKIAYFLSRFLDLHEIKHDSRINIDSLFRKNNSSKQNLEWKPHDKLKDSDNYFIHALFYILNDMRKVGDSDEVTKWLDPDAVAFAKIRNAMEHRSLKVVDDFGYSLITNHNTYSEDGLRMLHEEYIKLPDQIREIYFKLKQSNEVNDTNLSDQLQNQIDELKSQLQSVQSKIAEKEKLSSHSLLIPISQFESRLMQLIGLARNSIMYLSLAINFEERKKPKEGIYLEREVPLKNI